MKTTKVITITESDILETFISMTENCTVYKAKEIIAECDIYWDIKDTKENESENSYKVKNLTITINQ